MDTNQKWEHGKNKTLWFYKKKLPWKAAQFNRELNLPKYFKNLIGDKKEVTIAEIGSGMFCTIGSLWDDVKVNMYPSDILADEYNNMLKEAGIVPFIPVLKESMEELSYKDSFFDIVHCVNALDHTPDPKKALKEMYRVTKPKGFIYLRHFPNVGESEGYFGMHLWNICQKGDGDCEIWNKNERFILSSLFPNVSTSMKREADYENEDLVVTVIQKL